MADLIKLPNNGKVPVKNLNTIEFPDWVALDYLDSHYYFLTFNVGLEGEGILFQGQIDGIEFHLEHKYFICDIDIGYYIFESCPIGDLDKDGDVDGTDILKFINEETEISLADLAYNFGSKDCLNYK